ncbi:YtnP family quorum-quenching lactonase [Jeotgalibacillus soli]|uniref:Metallo-beta-lactamase domain-containing protein n=1 Tax=Jeotgalibacillus soli TaxID=889306 RepID=A0A0C2VHB8_9BACL|nr:MBL fold metallo-hydrolase [Jeotgalibacillus soli]KIL43896.1 hypothetical protein KP78_37200 [Jeotgalibacillus soli]
MDTLTFGEMKLTWLDGGITNLDGGGMFGVVPRPLWSKKYPHNEANQIELPTEPILLQVKNHNILIESGIGFGKLSDKKKKNYGVTRESNIEHSLAELDLKKEDINLILMTHLHFDHACGLTEVREGQLVSSFPNAKIHVSAIEWAEMKEPNIRSRNTYWEENWQPIQDQIITFDEEIEIFPTLHMVHTGGHSDGHSIIIMEQGEERLIHMGDLMPTHAHQNSLWVLAYDDYPMTSITAKEKWIKEGIENGWWFTFYHDSYYRALKWDKTGNSIHHVVERTPFI